MSIEVSASELKFAKGFLSHFTKNACDLVESDLLPVKPASFYCSREELKGECLYVALEYMNIRDAPEFLSTTVAHHAVSNILESDLTTFEADIEKEDDDQEEEKREEKSDEQKDKNSKVYDCFKLARATVNAVHSICKEWLTSMPELRKSCQHYEIYTHWEQNTRRKMEDKHTIITEVNNLFGLEKDFPSQAYFGVFDGHGGIEAAIYAAAHLHTNMMERDVFVDDVDEAMCQAFTMTDQRFVVKAHNESLRSGSTGVVAFLRGNTLHIGWLGDSQVSMCKRGMAVKLMDPHKPNREDERQRIEGQGGCVVWFGDWRVNGNISVSRAIGDKDHKPYVSGEPDTLEFDLEGDEEYLILACDGLWDTIAPPDVITIVQDHLKKGKPRDTVAKLLVCHAKDQGSTDNITVVVVFLDTHRSDHVSRTAEAVDEGTDSHGNSNVTQELSLPEASSQAIENGVTSSS